MESPVFSNYGPFRSYLSRDFFNWTMTYDPRSDIYAPYGRFVTDKSEEELKQLREDFSWDK